MPLSETYQVRYITDTDGNRQEVIIPFESWKNILNELELLREKEKVLLGLKQACTEARMQDECRMPEQCLEDFLNEL